MRGVNVVTLFIEFDLCMRSVAGTRWCTYSVNENGATHGHMSTNRRVSISQLLSSYCYLFYVLNSGLLFYTKRVLTTPTTPTPVTDTLARFQFFLALSVLQRLWSLWHSGAIQIRLLLLLSLTLVKLIVVLMSSRFSASSITTSTHGYARVRMYMRIFVQSSRSPFCRTYSSCRVENSNGTRQMKFQRCRSGHREQSTGTFALVLHLQRTVSVWIESPPLPAGLQRLRTLYWRLKSLSKWTDIHAWCECTSCLQCFDTVGWAAGRASGLYKNGGMVEVSTG